MKYILLMIMAVSGVAQAEVGDIQCKGAHRVITKDGIKDEQFAELKKSGETSRSVSFEGKVKDRTFVVSGDPSTGDFLVSQVWGTDYTEGINATTNFDSSGRLQISSIDTVDWNGLKGSRVYKLECNKTLASQFPKQ